MKPAAKKSKQKKASKNKSSVFEIDEKPEMIKNLVYLDSERRAIQNKNNQDRSKMVGTSLNAKQSNKRNKEARIVINAAHSQYDIIENVAAQTNTRVSYDVDEDWDIWWIDCMINPAFLHKMKPYQRANHIPNIQVIARKNYLAQNLKRMQAVLPHVYDFFPPTWVLPQESKIFKEQHNIKNPCTYIVKPEQQCQGNGIFLTKNIEWIMQGEHYVAQKYLAKPYLIEELKFDFRLYVLITGVSPLRCFIYKEGLARFATEKYEAP